MDKTDSSRRNKGQKHCQLEIITNWQQTQEISPALKRLLMLLLHPRNKRSVETSWPEKEHQNEK